MELTKALLFLVLVPAAGTAQPFKVGDTVYVNKGSRVNGTYVNVYSGDNPFKGKSADSTLDGSALIILKYKRPYSGANGWYITAQKDSQTYTIRLPEAIDNGEVDMNGIEKTTQFDLGGYIIEVKPGDTLHIGTGSMPDGDFKFIRRSETSLLSYYSDKGYQGLANQANAFPRRNSGLRYKVIRIDKRGDRRHGYVKYPVIENSILRYEVDLINAVASGEVIIPGYRPNPKGQVIIQETSLADELKKLKELKDQGILTEDEFQKAKSKLLNR